MAEIIIKKRVSLEFLGEDYNESYLVFKSIPVKDYADLQTQVEALKEDDTKSFAFIKGRIEDSFIDGKISQDGKLVDVTRDQLADLPASVYLEAFSQMTGKIDPKV